MNNKTDDDYDFDHFVRAQQRNVIFNKNIINSPNIFNIFFFVFVIIFFYMVSSQRARERRCTLITITILDHLHNLVVAAVVVVVSPVVDCSRNVSRIAVETVSKSQSIAFDCFFFLCKCNCKQSIAVAVRVTFVRWNAIFHLESLCLLVLLPLRSPLILVVRDACPQ